jgi:ribosome biogenesis protein SSF1/2
MGRRKGKKTPVGEPSPEEAAAPKSFVFRSGKVGKTIGHLVADMRKVMSPYTAERLKETKHNRLKDFLDVAGTLGVTHMLSFSQSELATNLRILRCPRGTPVGPALGCE